MESALSTWDHVLWDAGREDSHVLLHESRERLSEISGVLLDKMCNLSRW